MTRERELLAQADQYIAEYKTRIARQRESIASEDPFIMVALVTKTDRNSASAVSTALMTCMLYLAPAVFPQSDSLGELLVGKAAFGDWCTAAPLVRREITELPPPYATRSVSIKRNASASDPNVNFYSDSACSSTVTTFNLSGRTAMGQFFFKDGSASSITINLSLLNLLFASQSETILNSAPQPSPSPAPAPAASPAPAPIPTPSLNGITLNAVATAPHTYSTNFPTTDPSLSERGVWKTGVDPYQTAVAVTSEGGVNIAHGTQTGSNRPYAPYDDSSAYLTGFSRNHMIQGTVWKDPTLTGVSGFEIELLLSWGASYPTRSTSYGNTHSNGYEINVAYDGSYFIVGRFKGDALQWRSLSPRKPETNSQHR